MQGIECSFRHAYIQRQALLDTGMNQRKATEVFHEWAEKGKDAGMERGHAPSVDVMLNLLLEVLTNRFPQLTSDVGTGGWFASSLNTHCATTPRELMALWRWLKRRGKLTQMALIVLDNSPNGAPSNPLTSFIAWNVCITLNNQ